MKDLYEDKVTVVRCRRSDCERTFRHCPEGDDRGGQTPKDARMGGARVGARPVAALREPSAAVFGVSVSRMSAWRDVQETGRNARPKQAGRAREQAAAIGVDSTAVRAKGAKTVVGAVSDAATGEALELEALVERDSDGFMERLGDFARGFGVNEMGRGRPWRVQTGCQRLGVERQIRVARVKKRV